VQLDAVETRRHGIGRCGRELVNQFFDLCRFECTWRRMLHFFAPSRCGTQSVWIDENLYAVCNERRWGNRGEAARL
jgi:hypothetical protein